MAGQHLAQTSCDSAANLLCGRLHKCVGNFPVQPPGPRKNKPKSGISREQAKQVLFGSGKGTVYTPAQPLTAAGGGGGGGEGSKWSSCPTGQVGKKPRALYSDGGVSKKRSDCLSALVGYPVCTPLLVQGLPIRHKG